MKCEICHVNVNEEHMYRHLQDVHPRHPETVRLSKQTATPRRQKAPVSGKTKKIAVVILAVSVLVGLAVVFGPQTGIVSNPFPFPCVTGSLSYHWHTQLTITVAGQPYTIPANTGISGTCLEPVHTHDTSGLIHVESDQQQLYTIGNFFSVWGKPFGHPTMTVNGTAYGGGSGQVLWDQETINLAYSTSF